MAFLCYLFLSMLVQGTLAAESNPLFDANVQDSFIVKNDDYDDTQGNELPARPIDDEPAVQRACARLAPGIAYMARGVDAAQLHMEPLDSTQTEGFMQPVIQFTCNERKTWRNPYDSRTYDKPDQIMDIASIPGGIVDSNVYIYKSSDYVKVTHKRKVGIGILGIFGISKTYKKTQETIQNYTHYIEEASGMTSSYRADTIPPWVINLSPVVQAAIRGLPARHSPALQPIYERFINRYGTHLWTEGRFGGMLKMRFESETDLWIHMDDNRVKRNVGIMFDNWLGTIGAHRRPPRGVDRDFNMRTSSSARFYGGRGSLRDPNFFQKWQPTVYPQPWIYAGQLYALSDFIRWDNLRKTALTRATQVHMDVALLTEMDRGLDAFVTALSKLGDGNWDICRGSISRSVCNIIIPGRWGCQVTGCENLVYRVKAVQYAATANTIRTQVRAQIAARGMNHNSVVQLDGQYNTIIKKLYTDDSPLTYRTVEQTIIPCLSCGRRCRRLRCAPRIYGRIKVPANFWQ